MVDARRTIVEGAIFTVTDALKRMEETGLQKQLQKQVHGAGVRVLLVRLNDLSYAPEIAPAMLLRQQAQAMVDARRTLVEGAVATVREGLRRLDHAGVRLSIEIRTRLQANLVLLLCAGERGEAHSTVVSRQQQS